MGRHRNGRAAKAAIMAMVKVPVAAVGVLAREEPAVATRDAADMVGVVTVEVTAAPKVVSKEVATVVAGAAAVLAVAATELMAARVRAVWATAAMEVVKAAAWVVMTAAAKVAVVARR